MWGIALMLPGITLVISPLISLMQDQVASLKAAGVPAAYINSTLTGPQVQAVYRNLLAGKYDFKEGEYNYKTGKKM